jgi:type VI protein secretion system component VasF
MTNYDEHTLAEMLRRLPPAPEAWVQAAQQLPALRVTLEEIVERAAADAEFRRALLADLESALAAAGYEPERFIVENLRDRLVAE